MRLSRLLPILRAAWARAAPERVDRLAHSLYGAWQHWWFAASSSAGLGSYRTYRRLDLQPAPGPPVEVRLRQLGGAAVELRPCTSDATMLRETFRHGNRWPLPDGVDAGAMRHIVDLGANIGVTVAHAAHTHPQARIVAVELDPDNHALALRNTAPWRDRCALLQGAVWLEDGEVAFVHEPGQEYGIRVAENGDRRTRAVSIATVLSHLPDGARVDHLKMDVEGIESQLLTDPAAREWAARVDAISVDTHAPYSAEACARDLAALGFDASVDPRRRDRAAGVRR